jgi:serine/threonine protein kinase/tetratricopeptide (TPR) repeat protein
MRAEADAAALSGTAVGSTIGRYRLLEVLGQGGAGVVYRAVDADSGEPVAVKTVRSTRVAQLASIRREIEALRRIRHPGIVTILEGGTFEGRPWYAMPLLHGSTLRERIAGHVAQSVTAETEDASQPPSERPSGQTSTLDEWRTEGSLAPDRTIALGRDLPWFLSLIRRLCEPLAYIHGEGILHRDLKPSNIFVRSDGTPVLIDFGLVWQLQGEPGREVLSTGATRAGTAAYAAPEQALGERLDARADLFSLGCILYEGVTGRLPYRAQTLDELVEAHSGPAPRAPSVLVDGVPAALDALVMGLLERRPPDRIGHARDVAVALEQLGANPEAADDWPAAKDYLYRPRLVGRGGPLGQVLSTVTALETGRGGCVLVSGESGIGKTTFVSELARSSAIRRIRVLTGQCVAVVVGERSGQGRGGALYPFAPILQVVADHCLAAGRDETSRIFGERGRILAECEPSIGQLPAMAGYAPPPEVPAEAARRRLIEALGETLAAFARGQPTVLVLDDLQWADDLTLAFLGSLSERYMTANPLLIVGTYRSEERAPGLEPVIALPTTTSVALDRLSTAAIAAMAADMMGQRQLPPDLATFLSVESSGNPFFVAEYLRAAVDASLLFRDANGHWRQHDGQLALGDLGLPKTIAALVIRRLEGLEPVARRLGDVAAVLGREVEVEMLAQLARAVEAVASETEFEEGLQRLQVRQVLESTGSGSVRFVHDKLREIAYENLSAERKLELHRACGDLLERLHLKDETLDAISATLAHHFERAGELERAITYLDRAGEAAHRMHANQEATRLLERANDLERGIGIRAPLLTRARRQRMLGVNALALGDVKRAFSGLTSAVAIARIPWPGSRLRLAARSAVALGQEVRNRVVPWLGSRSRPNEEQRQLLLEAARGYERLLAVNYYATGDMAAVVLCALTNMILAERAGRASGELALGYATFGAMCSLVPMDGLARSYCQRAIQAARDSGDEVAETWVLVNVALVHLQSCRWEEMRDALERVRTIAGGMSFSRRWEEGTSQLSTGWLLAGNLSEATRLNDELLVSVERADPQSKCWAVVRQAELSVLKGDWAAALERGREGERLCRQDLGHAEQVYTLGPLMLARLNSGDLTGARDAADRCAGWIAKMSAPVFYNVFAHAAVAEVYISLYARGGDRAVARAAHKAVRQLAAIARPMKVAAPRAALWRGMERLIVKGDRKGAARYFQESLHRARQLRMPYDQGVALAALGEHAGLSPDETTTRLTEAASILRGIGALHDLNRVEGRLAVVRSA